MKIRHLLFLLLLISGGSSLAQETLVDLTYNAALAERASRVKQQSSASKYSVMPLDSILVLPFLEDFSREDVYPDSIRWKDRNVYINRTFPKAPPTLGVATFDGLRENGLAYNMAVQSGSSGYADTLTSAKINMSAVTDSVYFSFFYQAQGRGNAPEAQDSLILQFKVANQGDSVWTRVWAKAGYQLPTNDSAFNYVHLYVPDSFYYADFQFRFLNRATLSGNVDHWHIDYVYMNRPRTFNETGIFPDVSFVYPTTKLLKNYHAMPYRQYTIAEFDSTFWNPIRNNGSTFTNITYRMFVRNENGSVVYAHPGEIGNIDPYSVSGYTACPTSSGCPQMLNVTTENYTGFPMPADCTHYTISQKILQSSADMIPSNDSVRSVVNFHNYYAYDDGSAEQAWGVSSASSLVACKFTLTTPDTLRAVSVFWNPFVTNVEQHGIRITVWNDNSGQPGQILYQGALALPQYQLGYNGFKYYMVDDTLLKLSGTFYIGYMQIDPETLSVGMDMNTNVQSKIFYNTSGNWYNTSYKAAIMMRPHFGEAFVPMGVNETRPKPVSFRIYPNPANERVHINSTSAHEASKVNVFDAYGRQVLPQEIMTGEHSLDVSHLSAGIYFIRIETAGKISAHRVVITR